MALKEQVAAWLEAGVVDAETADRIHAFEASRDTPSGAVDGITAGEVIAYIGAVVLMVGVGFLYGTQYKSLGTAGRLSLAGLVVAAGFAASDLVRRVGGGSGAARRARAAGWTVAAVATAVWFSQALADAHLLTKPSANPYPGAPDDASGAVMLGTAIGCLLAALLLWRAGAGLLAFATAALGYFASGAFDAYFSAAPHPWAGEATWLVPAALWAVLAETAARSRLWAREVLRFAAVVPPVIAALGLSGTNGGEGLEAVAAALAAAAFAMAYWRASAGYAIGGGVALFIVVNEIGVRHFASSVGFPVVLIASGVTLMAMAGGLFRIRRHLIGVRVRGPLVGTSANGAELAAPHED